ncbi:MAG: dTDP-glucose 4,6-dehydratase [candidate division SR1 bacterium]|nr:dTDP-glucose 4,6-dehydratase [candidate division SR1 bacterium]
MLDLLQIKTILVTGGGGFIGSNFLNKYVVDLPEIRFINLDILTYAANLNNIKVSEASNYKFIQGDICDIDFLDSLFTTMAIDAVIHFAAESHVDLSIKNPKIFIETNVIGTHNLLEISRKYSIKRFHHVSTDEVYGSLGNTGYFTEESPINPSSPYSASKAGSDHLVNAYHQTFALNTTLSRCSNNYGPYQDTTKLIPKFISLLTSERKVPLYKDGKNVRDWLFVKDHIEAIWCIFSKAKSSSIYNIGGNNEKSNSEITQILLENFGKDESYIDYVADRPGHDFRYAIDASKIKKELGWEPIYTFEKGIKETIKFYTR